MSGAPADRMPLLSQAERLARATLLRVTEPASAALLRHVRSVGAVATVNDIRRERSIADVDVGALNHRLTTASGERDLEIATACGARLVCPGDEEWAPVLDDLASVGAEPLALWLRGALRLDQVTEQAVSVVGTRAATAYGDHVAAAMGSALADRGWTVVSGMAFGIDAAAHRGALGVSGRTIAVLAGGVDTPYPKQHQSLYNQIVERGLIVSEQPPGAAPHRQRFLIRNRLIAALGAGTVVVEAAARSGARSTARHAGELYRHVMAVPGPVTSGASAGCHQLLRDRPDTVLVTNADEVIEQIGPMGAFAERAVGPVRRRDLLGPTVSRVLDAVPVVRRASVQSIATTAGMRPDAVAGALAALAVHGLVDSADGGWGMTRLGRDERRTESKDTPQELPFGWL